MDIVQQITIQASAAVVYAQYEQVVSWPEWDREVTGVSLSNGLKVGSHGWLQPRSGPKASIQVTKVVPGVSFAIESLLPFCRMAFEHDLREHEQGTIAVHSVRFVGPLAFIFRRVIGKEIEQTLPSTLAGLKRVSEQNGARP